MAESTETVPKLSEPPKSSEPELVLVQNPPSKRTVCVIGAGASGLTCTRELVSLGHKVMVFEESYRIGGVYTKSYDRTMLTTSSVLTAFSDYSTGLEDKPKFYTDEDYLMYLDGFAQKFGIYDHIQFRTTVVKVGRCLATNKWLVTTKTGAYTWPHRSSFLMPAKFSDELRREVNEVHGAKTLKDFYDRAEKEGFENVKNTYKYDYYDHVTGEKQTMCPTQIDAGVTKTYAFDSLCVCTGTNTWASLPRFEGQEKFKGSLIHSENYKKPEVYRGKRVLVIGAGESGSDICNEIASEAAQVAIVVRNKHGHLIPRKQTDGRVTDLNTNRCRYSNPYCLGDWVGWANQHAKRFVALNGSGDGKTDEDRQVLAKIGELNLKQNTSAFSKFGCKNEGFVTAMVTKGTELHRDAFHLESNKAVFRDGSEFVCDAIVACTGYRNSFPFFEHPDVRDTVFHQKAGLRGKDIAEHVKNPRLNYKQVFHPDFPCAELGFFGFARPAFGSIPPCSEMQSKMFAMVTNGDLKLPSPDEMKQLCLKDTANYEWRFGYDAKRVKGLVDFQLYTDDLAEQMGILPPLGKLFFSKPKVWYKLMFSAFTMHQYRLQGPYANPKVAEAVYEKQPVGDFLECSITAAFLVTSKILSLIGFSDFTPNNF